jgi:hypothetical protein
VSRVLNGYFGKLVAAVTLYGGDVVKFAGDALLCVFDGRSHPLASDAENLKDELSLADIPPHLSIPGVASTKSIEEGCILKVIQIFFLRGKEELTGGSQLLALQAIRCGMHIQKYHGVFHSGIGFSLHIHAAVGVGTVTGYVLGDLTIVKHEFLYPIFK